MCLNPILRPNTNRTLSERLTRYYNGKPVKVYATSKLGNRIAARARAFGKDADSDFIYIPCGRCPECVAAKQNSLVQRVQMEAKHNHLFFCTLTYDNKHLPILNLEVPVRKEVRPVLEASGETVTLFQPEGLSSQDIIEQFENASIDDLTSIPDVSAADTADPLAHSDVVDGVSGEVLAVDYDSVSLPYADIHHVQLLLKNLRDNNPCDGRNIRYLAVSELGKANGRPHFHILFMLEKRPGDFIWNSGVYGVSPTVRYNLERQLWQAVFKYWAVNVGTRKNPKYEPLFTYRKRFLGSKVYTNFDLHYVDPAKTTNGTANVAYYVTKYIIKGSKRDARRQQFLRLNLSDSQYHEAWNTIKCRLLISKGLGLDPRFYTNEVKIACKNPNFSLCDYANYLRDIVDSSDDLPADDVSRPNPLTYRVCKRRIMVPNFAITDEIRRNLTADVGRAPGPIFISPDGKHRPLSHYYQTKGFIYTTIDALSIYLNYDDSTDVPHYNWNKEQKDRAYFEHEKRLVAIDCNSSFDTSPALLWGGTPGEDDNKTRCYGD